MPKNKIQLESFSPSEYIKTKQYEVYNRYSVTSILILCCFQPYSNIDVVGWGIRPRPYPTY